MKFSYQGILLDHFSRTDGKGYGHNSRKGFGDCRNSKCDSSKEHLKRFLSPQKSNTKNNRTYEQNRYGKPLAKNIEFPLQRCLDLLFLLEHSELRNWERDILAMVREEAYYFAPQAMTKVMNEGWACVVGETRVLPETLQQTYVRLKGHLDQ